MGRRVAGAIRGEMMDPATVFDLIGNTDVNQLAVEVNNHLNRVLTAPFVAMWRRISADYLHSDTGRNLNALTIIETELVTGHAVRVHRPHRYLEPAFR